MERIGIYGGTFNPPHAGHIRAAQYARQALGLSKLLMIPACIPPHKELEAGSPTPQQRLEMLRLALAGQEDLQVCDLELRRGGTSYTYETVEILSGMYPGAELVLCMGSDMFDSFEHWRQPNRILEKASVAVFSRGAKAEGELIARKQAQWEAQGAKVYVLDNPVVNISSTDLRRMLAFRCADPFLPEGVGGLHSPKRPLRHRPGLPKPADGGIGEGGRGASEPQPGDPCIRLPGYVGRVGKALGRGRDGCGPGRHAP